MRLPRTVRTPRRLGYGWLLAALTVATVACGTDGDAQPSAATTAESTAPSSSVEAPVVTSMPPSAEATTTSVPSTTTSTTVTSTTSPATVPAATEATIAEATPPLDSECAALERAYVAYRVALVESAPDPASTAVRAEFLGAAARNADATVDDPLLDLRAMVGLAEDLEALLSEHGYDMRNVPESAALEAVKAQVLSVESTTIDGLAETIPERCSTSISELLDVTVAVLDVIRTGSDPMSYPMPSSN